MTAKPSLWTRIRHALTGKPVGHEEATNSRDAQAAAARRAAAIENDARARSVQTQGQQFFF